MMIIFLVVRHKLKIHILGVFAFFLGDFPNLQLLELLDELLALQECGDQRSGSR